MAEIIVLTQELDGKQIAYSNVTEFLVQVSKSKNPKSGYKTKHKIVGNLAQAVALYRCYNIGNGFKKRLVMVGGNKPVLARQTSW